MGFIPWPSQDIEDSLDEFFTNRLTLRLMISHIQALNANKNVNSDGEARHRDTTSLAFDCRRISPWGFHEKALMDITEDGYNYGCNHKI
jgi:hypothetical protein